MAVCSFMPLLRGRKVKYMCDNAGVVGGCRKHYTGIPYLFPYVATYNNMHLINRIFETIVYIPTPPKAGNSDFMVSTKWRSNNNILADSLSRGDVADFVACCASYAPNEFPGTLMIVSQHIVA